MFQPFFVLHYITLHTSFQLCSIVFSPQCLLNTPQTPLGLAKGYFEEGGVSTARVWYQRAILNICSILFIPFLLLHPANVEFPKKIVIHYITLTLHSHYITLHSPFYLHIKQHTVHTKQTTNSTVHSAVSALFFTAASLFLPPWWFTDAATSLFIMLHCTALNSTALHCNALQFTALNWTVLYCTELHWTAVYCTVHCITLHCTKLMNWLHCTGLYLTASAVDNLYIAAALHKISPAVEPAPALLLLLLDATLAPILGQAAPIPVIWVKLPYYLYF